MRRVAIAFGLAALAALAGCGGWFDDDQATTQISGVAATGAPISSGVVRVVNAIGEWSMTRTGPDGHYAVTIGDFAPFVLSAVDGTGRTWYSYAPSGGTAHITPLTTLALLEASDGRVLAELMATWRETPLGESRVLDAARIVNANLRSLLSGVGVDPNTVNVFTAADFAANHTGLDALLDAMRVNLSCSAVACTHSITSPGGSVLVNWNGNLATTGITVSWRANAAEGAGAADSTSTTTSGGLPGAAGAGSDGNAAGTGDPPPAASGGTGGSVTLGLASCKAPVAGTYSMIVQTTVAGLSAISVPEVCVDGLAGAPASQSEFCGDPRTRAQLPPGVEIVNCTFAGDTGTITARITTPVVVEYTVKYVFVRR